MQDIRSSGPPVVTGLYDLNKSRARHHRSLKLGSKWRYLRSLVYAFKGYIFTIFIWMSGWLLLAAAIVQYQHKIKLLNFKTNRTVFFVNY